MEWDDLRYVLAVARAGSLASAARRLDVNQTTVARRLAAAETALGAKLYQRVDGDLRPTKAGVAAIDRAARIEQHVQALAPSRSATDDGPAGAVRVTAVPILVNRLLVPEMAQLTVTYPRLRVELIADARNLSLTRREADVALRLARPESGGSHLARRVGQVAYAVYGSRKRGAQCLPWITYEEGLRHLPQARWIAKASEGNAISPLLVSDAETLLQAVRAGLGKSLLPCFVADHDRGMKCLSDRPVLSRELWLISHYERRHSAPVAAFVDWLLQRVAQRLA